MISPRILVQFAIHIQGFKMLVSINGVIMWYNEVGRSRMEIQVTFWHPTFQQGIVLDCGCHTPRFGVRH